jgi:hypothetical protein
MSRCWQQFGIVILTFTALALTQRPEVAKASDLAPLSESHGLVEVRSLEALPSGVAAALSWQDGSRQDIADFDASYGSTAPSHQPSRWFLLGGVSSTYAVVAWESRAPSYPSRYFVHAVAYYSAQSAWVQHEEWILPTRPHTLDDLLQLLNSPETPTLTAQWKQEQQKIMLLGRQRASPVRRDGPLREQNISDDEVREIQGLVQERMPGAIVTISGVVSGCPCEDGPECVAQVWIAAYRAGTTRGLELSQINNRWSVGPVQQWWLDSESLRDRNFPSFQDRAAAQQTLNDRFPVCTLPKNSH